MSATLLATRMRLPLHRAEDVLEALVAAGLLIGSATPGSYPMRLLLRLFATEMAEQHAVPLRFRHNPMVVTAN